MGVVSMISFKVETEWIPDPFRNCGLGKWYKIEGVEEFDEVYVGYGNFLHFTLHETEACKEYQRAVEGVGCKHLPLVPKELLKKIRIVECLSIPF